MSLHGDLLEQAGLLALGDDRGRPKQASLRRAISAAYYALFHLLVDEGSSLVARGNRLNAIRALVSRAFAHSEMKAAASSFAGGTPRAAIARALGPSPVPGELKLVAKSFVQLQEARHWADYDVSRPIYRQQALDLVEMARKAFAAWEDVKKQEAAKLFLVSLLTFERVGRR
jgi:hypothetical protein